MPNVWEPRLYVIVREDLAFKFIQGEHVVAQFAMDQPKDFAEWKNRTIINLSVFNGIALEAELEKLKEKGLGDKCATFIEPDLGDKLTTIAIFENGDGKVASAVGHLPLASK